MRKALALGLVVFLFGCTGENSTKSNVEANNSAILEVQGGADTIYIYKQTNLQGESELLYSFTGGELQKPLETGVYQIEVDSGKRVTLYHESDEQPVIKVDFNITIEGSKGTDWAKYYESKRKQTLEEYVYPVREEIKNAEKSKAPKEVVDSLYELEGMVFRAYLDTMMRFVAIEGPEHIGLYASALRWVGDTELESVRMKLNALTSRYGQRSFIDQMETKLGLLERLANGKLAPTFELEDKAGDVIDLKSALGKRYTLVDFWASWCGPCRQESKVLGTIYDTYKDQGFEIISVSLDVDKYKWLQAVNKDERIWANLRTEGYESETACKYGISSVPYSVLLDAEGKIVAKQLHGSQLGEFLQDNLTP